ncbi:translocation protein sec63 [Cubamyces sp. BRFM 1775]|nr:translocation protein sec63 [Cubamyces sp. BRFM 1775]
MANYSYDESGNMAAYFVITFLSIFLIPYTLSPLFSTSKPQSLPSCQCQQCSAQRERTRKREQGSLFSPKLRRRTLVIIGGWSIVAFLVYKVKQADNENKVYDPFEILGISTSATTKEIKSHYKKLSRKFHPDKVKLAVNETMEAVEAKFVELTKAYKALTDENIRKNWELYGHPDGRQEISMGIAIPPWVVEARNNIWVLGAYGVIFGGALPAIVGRWWFGNREKTKDGVHTHSAAAFFKGLTEESGADEVAGAVGKAYRWEIRNRRISNLDPELSVMERQIKEKINGKWDELIKLAGAAPKEPESLRRAFILLYAHLLRVPVLHPRLKKELNPVLLHTPTLLNALLNISMARNWLLPTMAAMRLHACLAQGIPPTPLDLKAAQLPGIDPVEAATLPKSDDFSAAIEHLKESEPSALPDAQKALERLAHTEIVDASFKVIGERFVTPSSFVHLLVKLRLTPIAKDGTFVQLPKPETSEKRDNEFLNSKKDIEDLPSGEYVSGYAHAPLWPANRKPSWWIVLADVKSNKVVVPPMKISDIPVADPARGVDYRSYKIQFQAPQTVGLFTWKVFVVSDTFVGDEAAREITLKIDDPSVLAADEQDAEDDISEPEEDSLAGQMALMRGGQVKKRADEESDEESSTDDEERDAAKDGDDSSSDSD